MSRKNPTAIASIKKIHGVEVEDIQDEPKGTPVKTLKPVKAAKKPAQSKTQQQKASTHLEAGLEKIAKEEWAKHPNNPAVQAAEIAKVARRAKRAERRAARKAAGGTKPVKTPKAAKAPKVVVDPTPAIYRALLVRELARYGKKGGKIAQGLKAGKFTTARTKAKAEGKLQIVSVAYKAIQAELSAHDANVA